MKRILRIFLMLLAVFAASVISSCGKGSSINGKWTLDKINGMSVADYCASFGISEALLKTNLEISDSEFFMDGISGRNSVLFSKTESGISFDAGNGSIDVIYEISSDTVYYMMSSLKYEFKRI